jgi:hypothetical protein
MSAHRHTLRAIMESLPNPKRLGYFGTSFTKNNGVPKRKTTSESCCALIAIEAVLSVGEGGLLGWVGLVVCGSVEGLVDG